MLLGLHHLVRRAPSFDRSSFPLNTSFFACPFLNPHTVERADLISTHLLCVLPENSALYLRVQTPFSKALRPVPPPSPSPAPSPPENPPPLSLCADRALSSRLHHPFADVRRQQTKSWWIVVGWARPTLERNCLGTGRSAMCTCASRSLRIWTIKSCSDPARPSPIF